MRAVQFPGATTVYKLPGGTEANDLWVETIGDVSVTEWVLSPAEREAIAVGGRVQLVIHSHILPAFGMAAIVRGTNGELLGIEQDDEVQGVAVLLPTTVQRLKTWVLDAITMLEEGEQSPEIQNTIDGFKEILADLRPLNEKG